MLRHRPSSHPATPAGAPARERAAALAALASPVRVEVVSSLADRPATVRELSARLGRSRQALYHHLLTLERAGLIRRAGLRGAGRARERVYSAVPARMAVSARATSLLDRTAALRATGALLRLTQREFAAALQGGPWAQPATTRPPLAMRAKARLDAAALTRLNGLLESLMQLFRDAKGSNLGAPLFALTLVLTPARVAAMPPPRRAASRGKRKRGRS